MKRTEILDEILNENKTKRPVAITVVCILGFIGAAISLPVIFTSLAETVGAWYPPYLGLSVVVGFVCMIGLWKMKKWAAYVYTVFVITNQIVLLVMGVWNVMALLVPAIVVGIALYHVGKMD